MRCAVFVHFLLLSAWLVAQEKTIHVYVALCDNENQGIIPVPSTLGNGTDPANNLYWGAMYGVKSYFKRSSDWTLVKSENPEKNSVMERLLFKHKNRDIYLLADAYRGDEIKVCTQEFLMASSGKNAENISINGKSLFFGGGAQLLVYVGHDGLMDFDLNPALKKSEDPKEVIILACFSREYFSPHIKKSGAVPLLWTSHLMAPEAYSLKAALDGWIIGEGGVEIKERAAQSYNKYQKCGIKGARNLFVTGF